MGFNRLSIENTPETALLREFSNDMMTTYIVGGFSENSFQILIHCLLVKTVDEYCLNSRIDSV